MKNAIIMAAGKGTRMHSNVPKVLHEVCGVPMVELIVNELKQAGAQRIIAVTGFGHEAVEKVLGIDLPDYLVEMVITGVKAKMTADNIADAAAFLKKLF